MVKNWFWLIALSGLLASPGVNAQQAYLRVIDAKTRETIPSAHVCFEGLKSGTQRHYVTDIEGRVRNEMNETCKVAISYIGYLTSTDTIRSGMSKTYELTPTVLSINEVVITAQYEPEKADKSIYRVNVINSRQIEQAGATNLSDLFRNRLNMRIVNDGVFGSNLSLQGMSGQHVKFLVDGIPVIGRMDGKIDLNQLNLNNVDHVEIIEGPMSVIYGSNALAGVVNIITKENKTACLSTHADAYYESAGVYNFDAGASYNRKKHTFSVEGGRHFFGGYPNDSGRVREWKPRRQYTADAYYIYNHLNTKIKLGVQYFNDLLLFKGPLLPPYFETAFDSYFTTMRYSTRLEGSHNLGRSLYLNVLGSWAAYDRIKETYFKDLTTLQEVLSGNPEDQDTTGIRSWMVRTSLTRSDPSKTLNFQGGIDFSVESGTGKRITDNRQSLGDYAAFFSLKYEPTPLLKLQPGLRLIYNTRYHAPVVYSFSAKYALDEYTSIRGSYSRGFRTPTVKELYLYFVDINHNIRGNEDLRAEKSNNLSLGIRHSREKKKWAWQGEVNGFYNVIDDIIDLAWAGGTLYTYVNIEKFKTLGAEARAGLSLYPRFQAEAGISRTGRFNSLFTGNSEVEKFTYTTEVTAEFTYKVPSADLSFSAFYKYTGRMPQLLASGDSILEGYVRDYHTMDVSVSKGFLMNRLRISCGLKNLFDNTSIPSLSGSGGAHSSGNSPISIGWGRTAFIRINFQINKYH